MRKITIGHLKDAGACVDELRRIRALVGLSVEVTEEWCIEHASDFAWDWAAINLLSDAAKAEYDRTDATARAEYDRVFAAARAEYGRANAAALAEYDRARAALAEYDRARAALVEYERTSAALWAEYDQVRKPARAEYDRAIAAAWARAYIREGA